ncbi:deoxyuridylate hydroxymethyltransferase [Delftia phage PhiW-14]|uniref:Deoxyuridylate hydroxymethyltransferase n=1 Tax=Delftia phage PhiW-14 TaxID=665032 RepID=DUHM_BPW14|nr:thymidylate synthase [Delftia phage PhiW-14]C9DGK1.1 RecName: Full=Deoxyuridylate hydroxymethyltransferase; Short=Deoxyuridylate hydroxymethylase; AltName: Full=dUMP hydroxymethylase; Short=dUMP-HMase [Delftia phage PhiW-14]ACV50252.1 deoxyuridylate hydroxymethyltransferase [Delftia phage PhiW-14]
MNPFNIISDTGVSAAVYAGLSRAKCTGQYKECRNGGSTFLRNVKFHITDPRNRNLTLNGRKSNIFQMVAETFWVMSGSGNIKEFLEFFLPRAPQYSDDGINWHGAYGPRMYAHNQLQSAIDLLIKDKDTRRAYVMIADPTLDSAPAIEAAYGVGHSPKDVPCNREIHINIIEDKLCMKVIQRSGDMLFGTGSINPFEFTFLQELLSEATGYALGDYQWDVTDAHYYKAFEDQVNDVLRSEQTFWPNDGKPLGTRFTSATKMQEFFAGVVRVWVKQINRLIDLGDAHYAINDLFADYGVLPEGRLRDYAKMVTFYIAAKQGEIEGDFKALLTNIPTNTDLGQAILTSPFRKFGVVLGD